MNPLKKGDHGPGARDFQAALNDRLKIRHLGPLVKVDGTIGPDTLRAARKAAWALGAKAVTYDGIAHDHTVPVGVVRMVRNPGHRNPDQVARGHARMSHLRAVRKRRAHDAAHASQSRLLVVKHCLGAAEHYRANPGAYHYLAGGVANLVYLEPSPHDYRSDCSQFASSVQHDSGLPDLGPNGPLWVNTTIMAAHLQETAHPQPADFGMYGDRHSPHHVEVYLGAAGGPGHEFVGHGSPPIDSLTPGYPDFFLSNPCGV